MKDKELYLYFGICLIASILSSILIIKSDTKNKPTNKDCRVQIVPIFINGKSGFSYLTVCN